jgi:hypothetical protein
MMARGTRIRERKEGILGGYVGLAQWRGTGFSFGARRFAAMNDLLPAEVKDLVRMLDQANYKSNPMLKAAPDQSRKFCPRCEKDMVLRKPRAALTRQSHPGLLVVSAVQLHGERVARRRLDAERDAERRIVDWKGGHRGGLLDCSTIWRMARIINSGSLITTL